MDSGLQNAMIRLLSFPMPCIAAINGHAFGGGLAFAFSHDYRIMREDRGQFLNLSKSNQKFICE